VIRKLLGFSEQLHSGDSLWVCPGFSEFLFSESPLPDACSFISRNYVNPSEAKVLLKLSHMEQDAVESCETAELPALMYIIQLTSAYQT